MFIIATLILSSAASSLGFPTGLRIVNGSDVAEGEIPYITSLRVSNSHACGASILDETHILTAAHCVQGWNAVYFNIQVGVTTITKGENASNLIKCAKVTAHPGYNPGNGNGYPNDVAVIVLASSLNYSETIQPIMLPPALNATPENVPATVSGWGLSQTGGTLLTNLQKAEIIVYSDDACEKAHEITGPTNREYHICAGVPEGGKGQCNGDSGGPLVVNGTQVGIVSWSVKPCTAKGYPGVYTKVARHVDWIREQMASS